MLCNQGARVRVPPRPPSISLHYEVNVTTHVSCLGNYFRIARRKRHLYECGNNQELRFSVESRDVCVRSNFFWPTSASNQPDSCED